MQLEPFPKPGTPAARARAAVRILRNPYRRFRRLAAVAALTMLARPQADWFHLFCRSVAAN
jgi:hypothetical protein